MTDPWQIGQISSARVHIATGTGPFEHPSHSYNLSRALGITLSENWLDLEGDRLFLEDRGYAPGTIAWAPRVGITVGTEHELRCFVVGSRAVSGRRSG